MFVRSPISPGLQSQGRSQATISEVDIIRQFPKLDTEGLLRLLVHFPKNVDW